MICLIKNGVQQSVANQALHTHLPVGTHFRFVRGQWDGKSWKTYLSTKYCLVLGYSGSDFTVYDHGHKVKFFVNTNRLLGQCLELL